MKAILRTMVLASLAVCHAQSHAEPVRTDLPGGRWYLLSDPSGTPGPKPLVVMLHGGGGGPGHTASTSGWEDVAKARGWRVAYPAGNHQSGRESADTGRTWNAGNCCGRAVRLSSDDVSLVSSVISDVRDRHGIPLASGRPAVLVSGMSNGAMMTHRIACERPSEILAAAPVSGSFESSCRPSSPVAMFIVHGVLDKNVPVAGGFPERGILRDLAVATGTTPDKRPPLSLSWDLWTSANGCRPAPFPFPAATQASATGCRAPVSISLIPGHGHVWPRGSTRRDEPFDKDWDAPSRIADFFESAMRPPAPGAATRATRKR